MNVTTQEYKKMSKRAVPHSPVLKDCVKAFLFGGTLCTLGQVITNVARMNGLPPTEASLCGSLALMLLSAVLTALHVYDNLAKHGGAGMLVPITGFSNAVTSPAVEFQREGYILGVGAKMFSIAGPVVVYGTVASIVYGLIYWVTTLF